MDVQASTSTQRAVYAEKVPASQSRDVCSKRLVVPESKRKRVPSSQRTLLCAYAKWKSKLLYSS